MSRAWDRRRELKYVRRSERGTDGRTDGRDGDFVWAADVSDGDGAGVLMSRRLVNSAQNERKRKNEKANGPRASERRNEAGEEGGYC